jgi:hypothetical protein
MATFPYTPSFVHGETFTYAVQVHRFGDFSEQRYLRARQRGLRLAYDFARPSSATVAGITSWFLGHGGPRDTFTAVDHRDGSTHTVRFAAPTLDHLVGPIAAKRSLRVEFVLEVDGTTPIATAYTAPVIADFCDPVTATSGVVYPPPPTNPDSGFALAPQGGAPVFWQAGRWRVAGMPYGRLGGVMAGGDTPRIYAVPFYVADSTTILDALQLVVTNAFITGQARLGLYVAIGSHDLYPGSLLAAGSATLALTAVGPVSVQISATALVPNQLYYAAAVVTSLAAVTRDIRGVGADWYTMPLGITSGGAAIAWAGSHAFTLPSQFPPDIPPKVGINAMVPAIGLGVASGVVV